MDAPATTPDPVAIIQSLNADSLRERIARLDKERQALMVLLRAAIRRGEKEPAHA